MLYTVLILQLRIVPPIVVAKPFDTIKKNAVIIVRGAVSIAKVESYFAM